MEDCRHVTGRPERDLLVAGERVVPVPPGLLAGARQAVRTPGKSDPIDALAVARLPGPGLRRTTTRLAHATADAGSLVQVKICQANSPPSRPSATRSTSWTVNSANASPGWPHRCSAWLAAGR